MAFFNLCEASYLLNPLRLIYLLVGNSGTILSTRAWQVWEISKTRIMFYLNEQ